MLTALEPADGDSILSLADARAHLNLTADDSFHDTAVIALRDAAIDFVERYTGKALSQRLFEWTLDRFTSVINLPIGPVASDGAGISYYDSEGVDTPLVDGDWFFGRDRIVAAYGKSWPYANGHPGGVRITFKAGYEADIPPMLLAGVKLAMTSLFENRASPDFTAATRCCDGYRSPVL
ncbi:MAG: hypothetical protein V4696_01410 [Pseudomonadota bacterium]